MAEAAFHQHESACYDENGELVCGHIEILRHEHVGCVTESTVETLVCELPEHEHDMGCFSEKKDETQYFCGFDYKHTHNEDCYMGHKLICTLSEHTHTEDCLVEKTEEAKIVTIESEPAEDGAIAVITGVLPEGAAAKVEAVPLSTMELVDLFGEEKAGSMTGYVAYDIHVTVDGEEWEPAEGESLSVVMKNLPVAGETVGVLHVEEEATDTENAVTEEVEAVVTPEGDVEFETDGFSLYVFYTVDFHYSDTCFSVYVGTDVTLSEIFAQLGIEKNAADAVSVVFSSPELIAVESIENDWILHTLEPFNTEKTLTIVFGDGETLVLDVTDASIIGGSWQKVVTTSDPSTTEPTQLYSNDIIQTIMDLNSSNQVAVGWFRNGNGYTYGWGPGRPVFDGPDVSGTGTNYMAGLNQARMMLTDSIIQNDGRQKILFFISDGQPTEYITAEGETIRTTNGWEEGYEPHDRTMKAIADFRKDFIDDGCTYDQVQCYCIGIGTFEYDYLEAISSDGTVLGTTNFQRIRRVLDDKVTQGVGHYSNLTVVDELSEDVDFYTTDLDMMVQLVPTNGVGKTKILYQNGSVTQEGTGIIKSVSYSTSPKKTVTAVFEPSYQEVGGYRYCLSFNVKVNQNAYDKYAENLENHGVGYYSSATEFEENTIDGDQGTDYGANISSSVKPGFFSNKEATLTYTQSHIGEAGVTRTVPFDRPVVQVSVTSLNVEKVWSDGNENHDSDSVTVVLHAVDDQKNDKVVGTIVLNKQNQWKYTVTDIPKGYDYYVEETSVKDGYAPSITWSEETSTFRVENVPSDVSVKFRKVDEAEHAIEEEGVGFAIYEDEAMQKQVGTFATDGNGEFTVEGIRLGKTYWIEEQSAPKGFKPMTEIHSFTVTADGATFAFGDVYLLEDNDGTILIKNFGDDRLPMTGGHGREKLYAFGGAILATVVFVGAVKLIGNRRKKKAE